MLDRCDFDEQVQVRGERRSLRPDLVVRLPGDRCVVVDAKVTLAAYLEAVEADDEPGPRRAHAAHARHLRAHVDQLAAKAYWQQFPSAPEFVVLFVPGEAFLGPALEADPALLEHAYARGVHLATPTTLRDAAARRRPRLAHGVAGVRRAGGAGGGPRRPRAAVHPRRPRRQARPQPAASVAAYNATVGSLERSLLPSARRMAELGISGGEPLTGPREVDDVAKPVTAPALLDRPERGVSVLPTAASG